MPKEKKNKKQLAQTSSITTTTPTFSTTEYVTLPGCYHFLSPHEYSDATIGLLASLLQKETGDINFFEIFNDVGENDDQQRQAAHFIVLLEGKRADLPENYVSIEKCLILNRLITYIQQNAAQFTATLSHLRVEMMTNMTDNQRNGTIEYPKDFQQRQVDFGNRKHAQEIRRLLYFSHTELKEPMSLICLQNRITDHMHCLIDERNKFRSEFRSTGHDEMINIFKNSFMIIDQPHYGVNPVVICERKGPGQHAAKVSVTIVSLLHDFIEAHPDLIQLYDIEPSLHPPSPDYQLEEPRSISWQPCHLKACPGNQHRIIDYAELSFINIRQTRPNDTHVHFAQKLHTLKFIIRFRNNLDSKIYQIELQSLPFVIGQNTCQIPQLLTHVVLDDIKRFSKSQSVDVRIIKDHLLRYFTHRTGVRPKEYLRTFLDQELNKAKAGRRGFQIVEDIYLDFLVQFVHQVEFMGKHPILAMLYADGLFFGPCNAEATTIFMDNSTDIDTHKILLRFNSIKVDYAKIRTQPALGRIIKTNDCAIRVEIYSDVTRKTKPYTMDSSILFRDLSKLVSTAHSNTDSRTYVLSDIAGQQNRKIYRMLTEMGPYYHSHLHKITKTNEDYTPLTNVLNNVADEEVREIRETIFGPGHMTTPDAPTTVTNQQNNHDGLSSQNFLSPPKEELIQRVLSDPKLYEELERQLAMRNLTITTQQQASAVIDFNPTSYENQSESDSMNGINSSSEEEDVTQVEILQTNHITDFDDSFQTDPLAETPNLQALELAIDEIMAYIEPSQNSQ